MNKSCSHQSPRSGGFYLMILHEILSRPVGACNLLLVASFQGVALRCHIFPRLGHDHSEIVVSSPNFLLLACENSR